MEYQKPSELIEILQKHAQNKSLSPEHSIGHLSNTRDAAKRLIELDSAWAGHTVDDVIQAQELPLLERLHYLQRLAYNRNEQEKSQKEDELYLEMLEYDRNQKKVV